MSQFAYFVVQQGRKDEIEFYVVQKELLVLVH
jgi:hypothetical protein